jgi:uncharacterized protein (DUF433 family)
MAALDWSQYPAVESIPGKVSGAWVFKGTRLPVATVIENLEDLSIDEVIEQFDAPTIGYDCVRAHSILKTRPAAPSIVSRSHEAPQFVEQLTIA